MSLPLLSDYITNHPALAFLLRLVTPIHNRLANLFFSNQTPTMAQQQSEAEPFDPTKPGVPISYPIKTLQDLQSRAYFDSFHIDFNRASVPLRDSWSLPNRPRLLVCHDMAGGYTDDKRAQGGTNPEAFDLSHWRLMDVFVYFSHALVTLPPPCWTNTAHLHGVKVLGTFITEWDEGKLIANELLSTKESAQMYAERLTELAVALGFDGWLLNMEVSLDVNKIPNLKEFVSHLTNTMHSALPGSLVIWYDSITIDGKLSWQDQLNDKNKPFFDLCDGIFVNYTWRADYPKLSASVAGDRRYDVYMGIDVFGRNTFGGGQWNSNVALDLLKKEDVSAALFAPGWVYETKQPPDYQTAKTHWWGLVEKSWGVAQNYPTLLPFYSNFDQGHGYHFSVDGEQVLDTPWNNISCQGFQPYIGFNPQNPIQAIIDFKETSYSGGSSMTFKGKLEGDKDFQSKLFQGDIFLGDLALNVTFSVKSDSNSLMGLYFEYTSTSEERKSVLLAPFGGKHLSRKFDDVINTSQLENQAASVGWVVHEGGIAVSGNKITEIGVLCYRAGHKPHSDSSVNYYAVLGHISIMASKQNPLFPSSSLWLVEAQHVEWTTASEGSETVSAKVTWKLKDGTVTSFPRYNIYIEKVVGDQEPVRQFLGVALVQAIYVAEFVVSSDISGIKFIIQVCGINGSSQKLVDSPFLRLDKPKDQSLNSSQ